jgi:hypothetical protein
MTKTNNKYIKLPLPHYQEPGRTNLTKSHLKGLEKLGKVVMPPDSDFPAFSEIQAEKYVNRMVDYMYDDDRSAILIILKMFAIMPLFKIRWTMSLIETGSKWKGMMGAPFRMLQIALKGLIFTVYYSDMTEAQRIHSKIGYDAKIIM